MRGYQRQGLAQAIRSVGGEMYGITSEPQTLATEAGQTWGLDFPMIGDPHHEIADECRARGWLDLYVNTRGELSGSFTRGIDAPIHPKGYFQPGVLALTSKQRILYRWRGVPTRRNNGGATERPTPEHVWKRTEQALALRDAPDAELDAPSAVDMKGIPWPLFVLLLLANGNFWRPKGFGLSRRGPDDVGGQAARAAAKLAAFIAAWTAAFAFLPAGWVALSLLAWAACVVPGIVELHRLFQSVES